MAHAVHHVQLDTSVLKIWDFIRDINNWAPLVPGYAEHEIVNDTESTWKLHGDIGIIQKTVKLTVNITECNEPSYIRFQLSGLNSTCTGDGYFKATALSNQKTEVTGCLNLTVKGMMAPMINPTLRAIIPRVGKDFTEKVAATIMERQEIRAAYV